MAGHKTKAKVCFQSKDGWKDSFVPRTIKNIAGGTASGSGNGSEGDVWRAPRRQTIVPQSHAHPLPKLLRFGIQRHGRTTHQSMDSHIDSNLCALVPDFVNGQ